MLKYTMQTEEKYLEIKNNQAHAKIALQGGHIFHYQRHNEVPLLWLSEKALFQEGKAIRGGIPICFPWFGKHKSNASLAQHGFARTELWKLVLEEEIDADITHIRLELKDNESTLSQWNYHFKLHLDITTGAELTLALTTYNMDTKAFEITTALHSYFNISDISYVSVEGLKGCRYLNSLDNKRYKEEEHTLSVDQELDRIYFKPSKTIKLHDVNRTIVLESSHSNSLIVWNPWSEKSKAMLDMSNDGYKSMLCLETGNVEEDFRVIKPNESHTLRVVLSYEA